MPTKRKPTKRPEKERKRAVVAASVIAGKPAKEVAQDLGCTERHVERIVAEPETQYLITEAFRPLRSRLTTLATVATDAVEKALTAEKSDTADHKNRMAAVQRYGELLALAQGRLKEEVQEQGDRCQMTWEELCVLYRRRTVDVQTSNPHTPTVVPARP